jgi:hypothetical protein
LERIIAISQQRVELKFDPVELILQTAALLGARRL